VTVTNILTYLLMCWDYSKDFSICGLVHELKFDLLGGFSRLRILTWLWTVSRDVELSCSSLDRRVVIVRQTDRQTDKSEHKPVETKSAEATLILCDNNQLRLSLNMSVVVVLNIVYGRH